MAAVMGAKLDRHAERYELQGINYELNVWGRWVEKHMDFEGYPGVSALEAWRSGRGGGSPGHKILCLDMPPMVYAVHARLLQVLTEYEREAVWIWYVIRVKPDGTLWPIEHKCRKAGITEEALRKRVSRARRKLAGLPVD
jgi:hypothetical protein